jgi:hypothetical protein
MGWGSQDAEGFDGVGLVDDIRLGFWFVWAFPSGGRLPRLLPTNSWAKGRGCHGSNGVTVPYSGGAEGTRRVAETTDGSGQ